MEKKSPVLQVSFQGKSKFADLPNRSVMIRWMKRAMRTDGVITVRFVDLEEGLNLNSTYRHKDYATNVLTFDYCHDPVEADLVICVPVLLREAQDQNKTFKEHLAHLLVHGVLHAQGYDHMTEEEAKVMEQEETTVLTSLGFATPYPDREYTVFSSSSKK